MERALEAPPPHPPSPDLKSARGDRPGVGGGAHPCGPRPSGGSPDPSPGRDPQSQTRRPPRPGRPAPAPGCVSAPAPSRGCGLPPPAPRSPLAPGAAPPAPTPPPLPFPPTHPPCRPVTLCLLRLLSSQRPPAPVAAQSDSARSARPSTGPAEPRRHPRWAPALEQSSLAAALGSCAAGRRDPAGAPRAPRAARHGQPPLGAELPVSTAAPSPPATRRAPRSPYAPLSPARFCLPQAVALAGSLPPSPGKAHCGEAGAGGRGPAGYAGWPGRAGSPGPTLRPARQGWKEP